MISDELFQSILRVVLDETGEDIVGLWLVETWVQRAATGLDAASVRSITLAIVAQAVDSGKVVIGNFVGDDFHIWSNDQHEAIEKLDRLCGDPAQSLGPTDNVWLSGRDLNYRTVK
jgi:hypothetical protein